MDLFSSYGLTQKATHLLENVLQRAPRHTPTLERLLDLHLGAGNDRRTAELAAQLEQIHRERNDNVNADRFAELRQRYSKVAGSDGARICRRRHLCQLRQGRGPAAGAPSLYRQHDFAQASAAATAEPAPFEIAPEPAPAAEAAAPQSAPIEFEIPLAGLEPEAPPQEAPVAIAPEAEAPVAQDAAAEDAAPAQEPRMPSSQESARSWISPTNGKRFRLKCKSPKRLRRKRFTATSLELDPVLEPEPVSSEAVEATDTKAALEAVFDVELVGR